jgi:hypothetical protein
MPYDMSCQALRKKSRREWAIAAIESAKSMPIFKRWNGDARNGRLVAPRAGRNAA